MLCALETFQLISIGLERGRQPSFAASTSQFMIPAMGTLLPLIEVWISYMTALFFAGPGEVVGLEDFIAIIEVLLAEVMRLVLDQLNYSHRIPSPFIHGKTSPSIKASCASGYITYSTVPH